MLPILTLGALGCTTLIAGRGATVDGSLLVTHSNDGEANVDPRLVRVPARHHPAGTRRPIYYSPETYPRFVGFDRGVEAYHPARDQVPWKPLGYIPEVEHTYAYFEETYGALNEHGVGIGESTCSGRFAARPRGLGGKALFSVDQLTQIAMERANSSRAAVQLMGDLAVKEGFYGAGSSTEGSAESLLVIDTKEGFIFHILPDDSGSSAIWVAQRVPDDHVGVVANAFMVRDVNLSDTHNFLGSSNMYTIAQAHGLWDGSGPLDFTAAFSDGEYLHKFYSGRRVWGAYNMLAPSADLAADYEEWRASRPYPATLKPDQPVNVADFARVMRSYYEGTAFDQTKGLAAGPWGTPDHAMAGGTPAVHGNWERTIGLWRTSDSYIVQSRSGVPKSTTGVLWWGPHAAPTTAYVPFLSGLEALPDATLGHYEVLDKKTLFWACRWIFNLVQLKYVRMIVDVREVQDEIQSRGEEAVERATSDLSSATLSSAAEGEYIIQMAGELVDDALKRLWDLTDVLMFKYGDGFLAEIDREGKYTATPDPYPDWWLKEVNYTSGPPPVPESSEPMAVMSGNDSWHGHRRVRRRPRQG